MKETKLYILVGGQFTEDFWIEGCYDNLKLAKKHLDEIRVKNGDDAYYDDPYGNIHHTLESFWGEGLDYEKEELFLMVGAECFYTIYAVPLNQVPKFALDII